MPELPEIAHLEAQLRKFVLGKKIQEVKANADDKVFVKPLTNRKFIARTKGAEVTDVSRNGKYLIVELDSKKTVVLHMRLTGWLYVNSLSSQKANDLPKEKQVKLLEESGIYPERARDMVEQWPPRFVKFVWTIETGDEVAFIDQRRLARVWLLNVPLSEAGNHEPLAKLGVDLSQEQRPASEFVSQMQHHSAPIKAVLMDQALFSGIGTWMADEALFQERLHPEQEADTLPSDKLSSLYDKLIEISKEAAYVEEHNRPYPKDWLLPQRWERRHRKEKVLKTPNGFVVDIIRVRGRKTCYIPSLQKKLSFKEKDEPTANGTKTKRRKRN